jgi:hypothetical protein
MLSGVGPADELKSHGITPMVDPPGVGCNLVEHPFLFIGWQARTGAFVSQLRFDRAAEMSARDVWYPVIGKPPAHGIRAERRIYNQEPLKRLIGKELEPGSNCDRCLDHADRAQRQHQRTDDHGRRKGADILRGRHSPIDKAAPTH